MQFVYEYVKLYIKYRIRIQNSKNSAFLYGIERVESDWLWHLFKHKNEKPSNGANRS